MFGLFKKSPAQPKKTGIEKWLEEADNAFLVACQTHIAKSLDQFFTGRAIRYCLKLMNTEDRLYQGLDRYRHTVFTIDSTDTNTYYKTVEYDDIQLIRGISIPVGDAYKEVWVVHRNGKDTRVTEIRRIS